MDHTLLPSKITLEQITAKCVELYRTITPPLGENTPTSVTLAQIDDSVPTEEEVEWAVRRLRGHRSGGPSRMRAKKLWEWMQCHRATEEMAEADADGNLPETEGR